MALVDMQGWTDEEINLNLLLSSGQEKDFRLGLTLATNPQIELKDLTRVVAFAMFHFRESIRELGLEALAVQATGEELAHIGNNWHPTYLRGKSKVLYEAASKLGELDRVDKALLLVLAVQMTRTFPHGQIRQFPIAFLTYCELQSKSEAGRKTLDLKGRSVPVLPRQIAEWKIFSELEELNLSRCGMTRLPAEIAAMKCLRVLDLRDNYLEYLPEELGELKALHSLNLSYNRQLRALPASLSESQSLRELEIDIFKGLDLPSIARIASIREITMEANDNVNPFPVLAGLREVEHLNFSIAPEGDAIQFPKEMAHWRRLMSVRLRLLPNHPIPDFLSLLPDLHYLRIQNAGSFNLAAPSIPQHKLRFLWLENVSWKAWPANWIDFPNLESLKLKRTELKSLPPEFSKMMHLKELKIDGSPMAECPGFLTDLAALQELELSNCSMLAELPADLDKLRELETLTLENLNIKSLPEALFRMTWLWEIRIYGLQLHKETYQKLEAALPNTNVHWWNIRTADKAQSSGRGGSSS